MEPDEILMREYESIVKQIIHWDSHFWNKSNFFVAIQSAFIVVVLKEIKEQILGVSKIPLSFFILFIIIVTLFNIYLCYVWFRTNRRNREYVRDRTARAREIESHKKLKGILKTFRYPNERLPECHQSAEWEIHIPTGFIVVWLILIYFVICKFYVCCGG